MRLKARLTICFLCAAFLLIGLPVTAQQDTPAAQQIIAMINGWRIQQGTWPLRYNPVLEQMAIDQANYILSLPGIPQGGAIHNGRGGETPPERALLPQYAWASYGSPLNTAVGEIAYVGNSAQAAYAYWNSSTVHHNTALNPGYREIGVAALPHRFGRLYIVVLGSRPDVLPAIADVVGKTIYLTNERYSWARTPWIRNATLVRLFDTEGRSLDADWRPWAPTIPLPPVAGSKLFVAYSDGSTGMVITEVSLLTTDGNVLPTPTITPTLGSTATQTPAPTLGATRTAAAPTGTIPPTPTQANPGNAAPTPTMTAQQGAGTGRNILLIYNRRSFALVNGTTAPLNVQDVVFVKGSQTFPVTRWATQWLSGSLQALAGSDCLQVWSWQEANSLDKPSECRQRRSVITIAPNQMFWLDGEFQVRLRDTIFATCTAAEARCVVALPGA